MRSPIRMFAVAAAIAATTAAWSGPSGAQAGRGSAPGRTGAAAQNATAPRFERVHELKPTEGVFAYSRISPDGRVLAYASEMPHPNRRDVIQTVTLVDLAEKKIIFEEAGIDPYWSNDGARMIYSSFVDGGVSIRHHPSGRISRDVAPLSLGDYYSWAVRDGRDLILTIQSNYYHLDGDRAVLPHSRVTSCPGIGVGDRPMISHDGRRITTFVRGTVVVRGLTDCNDTFDTGIDGAKADFSFDGRYVAMQRAKASGEGYEIVVVDLQRKTLRVVTAALAGSSVFPSWTRDGRLSFRYDSPEYRGFLMASNVLSAPERTMAAASDRDRLPATRRWADVFGNAPRPTSSVTVVMIWGTWSAHSQTALGDLQRARDYFGARDTSITFATALEPATWRDDADRILAHARVSLPEIPLTKAGFAQTEGRNQIPSTLVFRDGRLIDRRLGPQSYEALRDWIGAIQSVKP